MKPESDIKRWKRVQELYHAARELRMTDRGRFLDYQCAGDPEMRILVQRLLESAEDGTFLADVFDDSRP
jgi:hypothetical protein